MADLVEFLLARIAEDEATAAPFCNDFGHVKQWRADEIGHKVREVGPTEFGLPDVISESVTHLHADHIARWDPDRVLAECEAKRQAVEQCQAIVNSDIEPPEAYQLADGVLLALALSYADHPDYRHEWRP